MNLKKKGRPHVAFPHTIESIEEIGARIVFSTSVLIIFSPLDIRFCSRILSRVRTAVSSRSHAAILDAMISTRQ